MRAFRSLWARLFPDRRRAIMDKRRLEHLLRAAGLSRSASKRVVFEFFNE